MARCMKLMECKNEQEGVTGRLAVGGSCTCTVQQWNDLNTPDHFVSVLALHLCLYSLRWLRFSWVRLPATFQFQLLFLVPVTLQLLTIGTSFPT